MFDIKAVREGFGRAASAYDEYALLQKRVREHCVLIAKHYWKNGAQILDAGSGTGALAQEAKEWRVTCLDVAQGMCEIAHTHSPRVINADAQRIPVHDDSFDGVFSSLMLQWANDPAAVFSEMARVVKPQSHLVLSTLVNGTLAELQAAFAAVDDHSHISEFLETHRILECAKQAGFNLVSARQNAVVDYYPDAIALMRALQVIGASHKQTERRRGLMTPKQFARMEQAYEKQRVSEGLPASWQVLYLVLQKA